MGWKQSSPLEAIDSCGNAAGVSRCDGLQGGGDVAFAESAEFHGQLESGDEFHTRELITIHGREQVVDDGVESADFAGVAGAGGRVEAGVDGREEICAAADAAVTAECDCIGEKFFGAHEDREAAGFTELHAELLEVFEVAAAVFDADDIGMFAEFGDEFEAEGGADTGGHVVKQQWQE